jgi:hypothetical protein
MKILFLALALAASSLVVKAQNQQTPADSLFIVTYTTGPAWQTNKAPGEQIHFKEHSANLGAWRKEGFITFGARYGDKGIIFVKAPSGAMVRERILSDPAVAQGLFRAAIEPLKPFYYGCVEKP